MYRNIATYTKNGKQIVWFATWDQDGSRIVEEHEIKPHLYYEDINYKESPWKSMNNKPLRRMEFNTTVERAEWIKSSVNTPLYEKLSPEKQFLLNEFYGIERDPEFIKFKLRTYYIDLEVEIDGCFPDPAFADFPLNVISIYDTLTDSMFVWTYKNNIEKCLTEKAINKIIEEVKTEYENKITNIYVYKFTHEYSMLNHFLKFWEKNPPDILSGWNIDGFDIIYLINRIKKIMPDGDERRLSPISWHKFSVKMSHEKSLKEDVIKYHIMGLSICDYMNLYKKFIPKSQQSFKLDYIAKMETGKGKLDYYDLGYDSMQDFMRKDFATFVKYNIIDTVLVKQIDDHRHFIELMRRICNMGLCEYENIFKSIPYILGGLCIEARHQGVKFLTDANRSENTKFESDGYEGAYVFPTIAGYYQNGIVSFDFNSLYPNTIATVNMSPETMVGKVISEIGDENTDIVIRKVNGEVVKMTTESFNNLLETKCCISANKVLFLKPNIKRGIIPSFLIKLYEGRVAIKGEMKTNKKLAKELDEQIKKLEKELKAIEETEKNI